MASLSGPCPGSLRRWLLVALALVCLGVVPASAQVPSGNGALPGSTFQGGDGNQDNAAPLVDWQGLQATGRVRHNPDPNAQDSAFAGGTKELLPGDWELTAENGGVNPGKANIRDAWSAVDQPGANTFLYLGFTREAGNGTTFVTFELNRDDRLWNNRHKTAIPCRTTGDVLISYDFHGANDVRIVVRRWTTTATDSASGCATAGTLETVKVTAGVQGAVNVSAIPSRLPGAYQPTVPRDRFGETALNLAAILDDAFGDKCLAFGSIWMHSRSSDSVASQMQDYVAPRALSVRTCAASGTKFFDLDADGERDPDEPGIPRFQIWADYDDDGVLDSGEPFAVSDDEGQYVIFDIRPPDGTYTLREQLLTRRSRTRRVASDWKCSRPNAGTPRGTPDAPGGRFGCGWGPIRSTDEPNATGRDFGNWFPARLTLEKVLRPANDPGRFDLLVNGEVTVPAAGDGAGTALSVPPGTYNVSEVAAAGTDLDDYDSSVWCRRVASRRGARRSGPVAGSVSLAAGQNASCTFYNIRPGAPAIAIRKLGPGRAMAGDRLNYTLEVTNIGDVPFPETAVVVADENCDQRPVLDSKGNDSNPSTLDPGDTWTYICSHKTTDGENCEPTRVNNKGEVRGTAGSTTVTDEDSISTIILCPEQPRPPIPVPPGPGPGPPPGPGPVVPPGPSPPNAGDAAVAGLLFKKATEGCIRTRVPRVAFRGTRIRRVRVFVNGREDRRLTVRKLQRLVFRPRVRRPPGTYRVRVHVVFQRGSGTPPLTLRGRIAICGHAAAPRFTG